ncbi:hypothetical protein [Kitasatospora sp. NPDC050543]|uniref:hypothetical protein n=1 Tax=Kitasatospora sp. NPDC050543 TaxID=3364054 RepID=UPI0037A922BA
MSVSSNLLAANVSSIETDATGWTAGTNTTLAQSSTKFYAGSKSLAMTRTTSSGAASATTASRVAVTAGTVYTAYAYYALVVAAAGRTATVRVDWWAASSGGTAISSVTSPTATLANSTAWNTPPPILIGTAPVGATFASVTLTVSGMSTSEVVCVDAIALGPPALLAGNLLPYAAQSVEQDATSWGAWFGCTLTRSATACQEGWWSLQATSTGTGNTDIGGPSVTISPGSTYLAYAWVLPSTAGLTVSAEIRWQDASSVAIGTPQTVSWPALPTGTWTRCAVSGVAPAGAAKAILVMHPQATSAGQTWLLDQMFIGSVTVEAGNLLDYGRYGMETGISGWTVSGGTAVMSSAQAAEGAMSLALTCAGPGEAVVSLATPVPVTAGQAYRFRPVLMPPVSTAEYVVRLAWLDSGGQTIRLTSATYVASAGATYTSDLAPVGAVSVRPSFVRIGATAGEVWYLDKMYLGAGGLAARVEQIVGGYGVRIFVQGLTTDGRTKWGLWRIGPDGSQTPVRGYTGDLTSTTITSDLAVAEDYEAPLGVAVSYYAKVWTIGTDWIAYTSDQLTVPALGELTVLLKDPVIPARNLALVVTTLPTWKRSARQGVHAIRGRARPVILTDVRAARAGSLTLSTATEAERDALWWLLDSGHTLLAQWPSTWSEPDTYLQVGDAEETRLSDYAPQPDRGWTLELTEVDRPVGALVGSAGRTWQTVKDGNATWFDVMAHATTWLDVLTGVGGS